LPQFKSHPGLVDALTFESIIQLAHTGIEKIAALVNAALDRGYVNAIAAGLQCGIEHQAPVSTVNQDGAQDEVSTPQLD